MKVHSGKETGLKDSYPVPCLTEISRVGRTTNEEVQ